MNFLISTFVWLATATALAQVNENGTLPASFRNLPAASTCEVWKIGSMGGEDTKVGAAEVRVLLENEPVVSVKSNVKEANFTFGRRHAAGEDHSQNGSYCSYVFDESMPEQRVVKYFCSDLNERSWMNNTYSSISISNRTGKINRICKEAEYRNAALSAARCWKLSNCQ